MVVRMRELRYVGPGSDGDHVVVATVDGDEKFSLILDDDLRARTPAAAAETADAATISPREIQTRVRAGETPQALASEADLPVEKILVFAGPVLDERERVIHEARRGRASRSDGHLVVFGEAVDGRFTAHGIDPSAVRWDACRREDGQWLISATWRGGDIDRTAHWSFVLAGRTLTAVDETAGDLLSDRPIRPIAAPIPDPTPAARDAKVRLDADADTGPLPPVVGSPAQAASATRQLSDERADQPLPLHFMAESAAEPAMTGAPRRSGARRPVPMVQTTAAEQETDEQKAARARIPSWDDIMLGVRRKRD